MMKMKTYKNQQNRQGERKSSKQIKIDIFAFGYFLSEYYITGISSIRTAEPTCPYQTEIRF